MSKIYTVETSEESDEQKQITIQEDVVRVVKVTISDLKMEHAELLKVIEDSKEKADKIVDEMQDINDSNDIDITISDIPSKLLVVAPK